LLALVHPVAEIFSSTVHWMIKPDLWALLKD